MKFFAIHLHDLEGEAFSAATDQQIVTWLFLHAFCAKHMNDGEIPEAAAIPAKHWQRHGIEHHQILADPSPLWEWIGTTLRIKPYDIDGQALYAVKSRGGREGAAKRWDRTPNGTPIGTPDASNPTLPNQTQSKKTQPDPTLPDPRKANPTEANLSQSDTSEAESIPQNDAEDTTKDGDDKTAQDGKDDGVFDFSLLGRKDGWTDGNGKAGSHSLDAWMTARIYGYTQHEIESAFKAAEKQGFRDKKGSPIKNVAGFIKSYAEAMRKNGPRQEGPRPTTDQFKFKSERNGLRPFD
ncbi:MAG: hypothetical protein ACO3JG_14060 [Luteolibacter sp.]